MTQQWAPSSEHLFEAMSVGERVRWILEVREVKQTEIAERIGITQAGISNVVTDASRKPSAPTLLALARELEINPQWLLDGKGDPFAWAPVTASDQVELLNLYKAASKQGRAAILATARAVG